jgi:hypothetical protein
MGLWVKSIVIFNAIRAYGQQSIRSLADRTGLSKSSVHRHLQAMDRRHRYPESSLWETPAGHAWLIRLVVATLLVFGLKRGVGAETLSEFFSRLRWETHVGCSPSALRHVMHTLEHLILETATAWEKEGIAHGEIRPVIGAVDETFLQRMMLVFMDLATGYLLLEEVAADRSFDTWCDRANARLTTFGTEVLYMVSDRAKALIKLVQKGLGCPSIPDLFHLGHDFGQELFAGHLRSTAARQTGAGTNDAASGESAEEHQGRPGPSRPGTGPGRRLRRLGDSLAGGWPCLAAAPLQCVAHPASLAAGGLNLPDVQGG